MSDPVRDFQDAMAAAGLACPKEIVPDGKLHRFKPAGVRSSSEPGWYVFYPDDPASGSFGSWQTGEKHTWTAKREKPLSVAERAELSRRAEHAKRQREAEDREVKAHAKRRAEFFWDRAGDLEPSHPYLVRKKVGAPAGIRRLKDSIVVPVQDAAGTLHSLQFIRPDGGKFFLKGGLVEGCFARLGGKGALVIAEGLATAISIHEATGYSVAVAFNAGNLVPVARALRAKYPNREIIIAADNDRRTLGNPGVTKATEAARAIGARLAVPEFPEDDRESTDFNDLSRLRGPSAVCDAFLEAGSPGKTSSPFDQAEPLPEPSDVPDAPHDPKAPLPSPPPETSLAPEGASLEEFELHHADKASKISLDLARAFKGRLLYDENRLKWYRFDRVWKLASRGEIQRTLLTIFDKHLPQGFTPNTLTSTEMLLTARLGVAIDSWNEDRSLIPLENGVLDVRTMQLSEHAPEQMLNWKLPYGFDAAARCPVTEDFIRRLAHGDLETERTLLAFLAALIHGRADLQKYLELIGLPGTGKSTFLKIAQALVGTENTASTSMDALSSRFETATFYGKRLIIVADSSNFMANVDTFKSITGCDPIRYEEKNIQAGKPFIFGGMVILAANSPVQFEDKSTAMMRRRIPVHIDRRIKDAERDPRLEQKLMAELPGLLNLLLTFSQAEIEAQLGKATNVQRDSIRRALIDTNPVAEWLDEACVADLLSETKIGSIERDGSEIKNADTCLYPNYVKWAEATGKRGLITSKNFSRTLLEILDVFGIPAQALPRRASGHFIKGIRFRKDYDTQTTLIRGESVT